MSEREAPLNPNPTSGGSTASPSLPTDPADLPPPPPTTTTNDDVEDANEMMANVNITDNDTRQDTAAAAAAAGPPAGFTFNFNKDDNDDDDDAEEEMEGPPDILSTLPPIIFQRVEQLKVLHNQREELMEEYLKERAALEAKFAMKYKPLYEERCAIVNGAADGDGEKEEEEVQKKEGEDKEGVVEEVQEGDEDDGSEKDHDEDEEEEDESNMKGIPQFWLCAMGHMQAVGEVITESDLPCLEHLQNVTCDDHTNGQGFTLTFYFDAENNPYFTNATLTKVYDIPNLLLEDEPILKNVKGCSIDWREGKDLTFRKTQKKQRAKSGRNAGQVRVVTKRERQESFFHFFSPPKMPSMECMDEEEADAIEEAFDHDYDVAQAFRSHLIPKAVLWFTGEALDEIDEALLESALLDQAGAQGVAAAGAGASPFPPPAQDGQNPEECKQS